jgi:hypothetical protein
MTNIQVQGNKEIDLLAIDPLSGQRYHVESRVATTFKLRDKATYLKDGRCHKDGLDYFSKEKFEHPQIKAFINAIFLNANYQKILVVWNTHGEQITKIAESEYGIRVMQMKEIINEFLKSTRTSGSRDDVLRILELVSLARKEEKSLQKSVAKKVRKVKANANKT